MSNAATTTAGQAIDLETFATLHEESQQLEELDIGSALIYKILHPVMGLLVLVNAGTSGACAMMPLV